MSKILNIAMQSALLILLLLTIAFEGVSSAERAVTPVYNSKMGSMTASTQRRQALVIGNSRYQFTSPLKNPTNDAEDIATALEGVGFEVSLEINAVHRSMENAIILFGRKLRKGGVGLFYYAGHGAQMAGRNYLIPVDAKIDSESDIKFEAVDAGRLLGKMEDAGNGLNIIILDACRNNPFSSKYRSANRGLVKMDAPAGSILAYSTAPGSIAADGDGRNGLYTSKLLKFIREGGVSIESFFKKVRIEVMQASGNSQVPWESSSLTANFYFIPPAISKFNTGEKSFTKDAEESADTVFWKSVKDSKDVKQYQYYIDKFPDGMFINLAKLYIQKYENHKNKISSNLNQTDSNIALKTTKYREKPKKIDFHNKASDYAPVSGSNWEFRVLTLENTGKQLWKGMGLKLGDDYHIGLKGDNLSFWRAKVEVKRKKPGIDLDSQWMKLTYRVYNGEQKSVAPLANIINFMGKEVASKGSFKISFGRKKLSKPTNLDLLFSAPKNSRDIKYMYLQFLDYSKVHVVSR